MGWLPLQGVSSPDIATIVKITQDEYDLLSPPDPSTLYLIVPAVPTLTPMEAYMEAVLALSPWAAWPLQETSGTTAADASGNGRDGQILSGITLGQEGPLGALATEHAGSVGAGTSMTGIYVPAAPSLSGDWSFVGWMRQTAGGTQSHLFASSTSLSNGAYWSINNRSAAALMVAARSTAGVTTMAPASGQPVVPADSAWHLVGVTRSGSTLSFYVDGVLSHTATTPTPPAGITEMAIGRMRSGPDFYAFSGRLAGLAFFLSALTGADHLAIFEAGTT